MTATIDRPLSRFTQRFSSRRFTPWLGVDVGTYAVKLAVVVPERANSLRLVHAQRLAWPAGTEPFASAEQFQQALKQILKDTRTDWSHHDVRTAALTLPACALSEQPLADVTEAAASIQQIYQASPGDLAFDSWTTSDEDDATLVWADPDVVRGAIKAFTKCGLTADVLDTSTFATARASQLASADTARSELVVDWSAGGITLTWLLDGQPQFTRTSIHGGCLEVLETIAQTFELDIPEAELLLSRYGLPGSVNVELCTHIEHCLTEPLDFVLQEVDRTVNFLASRYPGRGVESCLLIGGGAAIANLSEWISRQTGLATRAWSLNSTAGSPGDCDLIPAPLFAQAAALSALALES